MSAPVPVAVVEAGVAATRAFLRIEGAGEDALLGELVRVAFDTGEAFTRAALVTRAFEETVAADGGWSTLSRGPVIAVTAAMIGVTATPFEVEIDVDGRARVRVSGGGRARVAYTAGFAPDWSALPPGVRHGVVRMAALLFEDRASGAAPPPGVAAMWRPWRRAVLR